MKTFEEKYGFTPTTDGEMQGFEYTIPDGFTAEIKDGKVIVKKQESEDERIRKHLIARLKSLPVTDGIFDHTITKGDCLTWLEKQKEQKPAESISQLTVRGKGVYKICPHCKSRMIRDDSKVYTSMPPQYGYNCPKCGTMEFDTVMYDNPETEEQKPAEWSEEDEENFIWFDKLFRAESIVIDGRDIPQDKYLWFKSIRPQPHWKPSEEQMLALANALSLAKSCGEESSFDLRTLYEQLQKL